MVVASLFLESGLARPVAWSTVGLPGTRATGVRLRGMREVRDRHRRVREVVGKLVGVGVTGKVAGMEVE